MTPDHECGWCGLKYAEGQHFYDDTCNPCARQHGLEVPRDWKPAEPSRGPLWDSIVHGLRSQGWSKAEAEQEADNRIAAKEEGR